MGGVRTTCRRIHAWAFLGQKGPAKLSPYSLVYELLLRHRVKGKRRSFFLNEVKDLPFLLIEKKFRVL
jgi:hypothetical protein